MKPRWALIGSTVAVTACGDSSLLALTIRLEAEPAVLDVSRVAVEVKLAERGASGEFAAQTFPQTFSISSATGDGDVSIVATAYQAEVAVASARLATPLSSGTRSLRLMPHDFVAHGNFAGEQTTVAQNTPENSGQQLAALADGGFDVAYQQNCFISDRCELYSRRFDVRSRPVKTTAAGGGDREWALARLSSPHVQYPPVLVAGANETMMLWLSIDEAAPGLFCASLRSDGSLAAEHLVVAGNYVYPVAAATPSGAAAVMVNATVAGGRQLRLLRLDAGCVLKGTATDVSDVNADLDLSALAARDDGYLAVWRQGDKFFYRRISLAGATVAGPQSVFTPEAGVTVDFPALAPLGAGWALAYMADRDGAAEQLRIQRLDAAGAVAGAPILVADGVFRINRASITGSSEGLMVAWSACATAGCETGADVYAQLLWPTGLWRGQPMVVNNVLTGMQHAPSVVALRSDAAKHVYAVAFTDESSVGPDQDSKAVRVRVIYPHPEVADGTLGADCQTGNPPCGGGLVCLAGSDGTPRCTYSCNPSGATPHCPKGGVCTRQGVAGCLF